MESEGSLSSLKESAAGPYSKPDESNPRHTKFKINFNIIFISTPKPPKWCLPFR